MKKIYHVYYEGTGEVEGMFDENLNILGAWCLNDANWRNEYFDGFIMELGFDIVDAPNDEVRKECIKRLCAVFNMPVEDEDDEDE